MPLYVQVEILQAISALATNANTNEMCYLSRELQLLVLTTGTSAGCLCRDICIARIMDSTLLHNVHNVSAFGSARNILYLNVTFNVS